VAGCGECSDELRVLVPRSYLVSYILLLSDKRSPNSICARECSRPAQDPQVGNTSFCKDGQNRCLPPPPLLVIVIAIIRKLVNFKVSSFS
jgi:hypothetical protein